MHDQHGRYARLRYTATGALAGLAAAGVIVGTVALAATPRPKTHGHAAVANSPTKAPPNPLPRKTHTPQPAINHQPFLNDVQQLVNDGTITASEGQAVDREIRAGTVDPDTLASSGFTQTQLQAVQQTLSNTKRAFRPAVPRPPK